MTHSWRDLMALGSWRRGVCILLVTAVLGAWMPSLAFGEVDDIVPGVPLTPSPVSGSVSDADPIDIYSVALLEGDSLSLTASVAEGSASIAILDPGASTYSPPVTSVTVNPGVSQTVNLRAYSDGTYYVRLSRQTSQCAYSFTWSIVAPPTPVIVLSPTAVDLVVAKDGASSEPVEVTVSNVNSSVGNFAWTASGDQPWLRIGAAEMPELPLSVSADGAGLGLGTYYGNVTVSAKRAVSVVLPVRLRVLPGVAISSSATKKVVGYNKRVTLTAKLKNKDGKILKGRALTLYSELDGDDWKRVKTVRSNTGSYKTTVPINYRTRFRWVFSGDTKYGPGTSKARTARCRAYLTPPKVPKTQGFYSTYSGRGTLKPPLREGSGTVTVSYYAWKRAGYWSLIHRETIGVTEGSYVARCAWQGYGRWKCRVRASFRGPDHALTYSAWRYFRVQ